MDGETDSHAPLLFPFMRPTLLLPLLFTAARLAAAAELHVDPETGSDSADGQKAPLKTIARAIRLAQPGDTVHLAPRRFYESADLSGKMGTVEKPITLEGHGAVLDGSEPVLAADWEALGDGLFRKIKLLPHNDAAIVGRWFFLWDGKMNHMGRTSKGPSAPLKRPADLQPVEWTYAKEEDAFYLRLPAGQSLDAANIRYPKRSSGVILSGKGEHLIVRNVIATHVYNDGFNIHGAQRNAQFFNIAAIECGDDGFSAHEDAECRTDGFVSIGNSTGLCDTVSSVTHFRNVFIRDCLGYDVFFIGDSPHSLENAVIESSAAYSFAAGQHSDRPQKGPGTVVLKNVFFRRTPEGKAFRVDKNTVVTADRCTLGSLNVHVGPASTLELTHSSIGSPAAATKPSITLLAGSTWRGDGNAYDLKALHLDKTVFTAATFADFQKANGSDATSRWTSEPAPAGVGAAPTALEPAEKMAADVLRRWAEAR